MTTFLPRRLFVCLLVTVVGMGAGLLHGADAKSPSELNDGYSTFYHFCDQESQLSLLVWIKTMPPGIADYAKRISETAKDDMAILNKFAANDAALRLDKVSLPSFERGVRASMDEDRQKEMVWKNSGAAFARSVCMTQSEATNYGLHVAKVLAATEPDPDRARTMQRIYEKWAALHAEAYKLVQ